MLDLEHTLEVICSFSELEWKIFNIRCRDNKEEFLHKVFQRLSQDEIRQLEKISVCQLIEDETEIFSFINECGGKFWFQPLTQDDGDTLRIRDFYLSL